jgi:predicted ribosomally synthesized peptide with SipW-like signal peptide
MSDKEAFGLSRREVLAGLGTIGVASAGAGLGTTAYFSDREDFEGNQLVAGELDLLVDWTEHYSDWMGKETEVDVFMTDPDDPAYTPVPTYDFPMLWVADKDLFQEYTTIESFPDTADAGMENDGIQDVVPSDDECAYIKKYLRDGSGGWISPLASSARTNGTVNGQTTNVTVGDLANSDPLINIEDVKPGDFGEVTFSLHLCDNDGYIWMNGRIDPNATSENGLTEPEAKDPDEKDGVVELLKELRAVIWYDYGTDADGDGYPWEGPYATNPTDPDEGDNVQQAGEPTLVTHGSLASVMTALNAGDLGIALDAVPNNGSTQVMPMGGMGGSLPGKTDWNETFYPKPQQGIVECGDVNSDWTTAKKLEGGTQLPVNGDVAVFSTSSGMLAIQGFGEDDGQPYSIAFESTFPVAGVLVKGGRDSYGWTPVGQSYSSGTTGFDYDFANDTYTGADPNSDPVLYAPDNQGGNQASISNVQFCIEPNGDEPPNGENGRECFRASTTVSIGFAWYLPVDHANEIQTDTVGFDLGFYTEQCRHNDGSGQPPE